MDCSQCNERYHIQTTLQGKKEKINDISFGGQIDKFFSHIIGDNVQKNL